MKFVLLSLFFSCFSVLNAANLNDNSVSFVIFQYPKERKDYPYGHAALRVSGAGYDNLYEFCVVGALEQGIGKGVLNVWRHAPDGILARTDNGAMVTSYKTPTTPEQNELLKKHFVSLSSCVKEKVQDRTSYEPNEPYHFLTNNCVTTAVALFEKATGIILTKNNQGKTLSCSEYVGLSVLHYTNCYKWPAHTFMPSDLVDALKNDARFRPVYADDAVVIDIDSL